MVVQESNFVQNPGCLESGEMDPLYFRCIRGIVVVLLAFAGAVKYHVPGIHLLQPAFQTEKGFARGYV